MSQIFNLENVTAVVYYHCYIVTLFTLYWKKKKNVMLESDILRHPLCGSNKVVNLGKL